MADRKPLLQRLGWQVIAAIGVGMVVFREIALRGSELALHLGESDDATRLIQVREWLAGRSWFDLHTDRFGLADGMTSHWSRLLDAPIGGLIRFFSLVTDPDRAELLARAAWPLLLLIPLFAIIVGTADRQGGRIAALLAMFYTATCIPALEKFAIGRIDHHNAMIVCAIGAILFAMRAYAVPRLAWWAGALAGLGLAIGYESIVLTGVLFAAVVLIGLADGRHAAVAARVTTGAALTLCLALAATIPPGRWLAIHCDSLALNLVLAMGIGAAGVAVMAWCLAGASWISRALVLVPFAIAAAAAYAVSEPNCLAGPFGQVSAVTRSYWLDNVMETNSILEFGRHAPAAAIAAALFLALALAAQVSIWRTKPDAPGAILLLVALAAATSLACWQVKLLPYAVVLAGLPLALFAARIPAQGVLSEVMARALFVLVGNLLVLQVLFVGLTPVVATSGPSREACSSSSVLQPLAELAPGRILAPMDVGAFIVAHTPHNVLSAPYHRLDAAIVQQAALWTATDMADAENRLRAANIRYVVNCAGLNEPVALAQTHPPGLRVLLDAGHVPDFLVPVPLPAAAPLTVYRLR
jgi:hypothetical protein